MNQIDITISKECTHCGTKTPLRFSLQRPFTLSDHSRIGVQIDPDEFLPCATCGNPLHLHIQAQPHELVNHLDDTPIARQLYQQQLRDESEKISPPKNEAMPIMINPNCLSEMFGNREDRTTAEIIEIASSLKEGEAMSCDTSIWPDMKLVITLDKQLDLPLIDIELNVGHGFHFKPYNNHSKFSRPGRYSNKVDKWHYSGYMTLQDTIESFKLEDNNMINPDPLPPGAWSGWRVISFGTPIPEHIIKRDFPVP